VANARSPLTWAVALSGAGAAVVQLFEGLTEVVLLTSVGNVLLLVGLVAFTLTPLASPVFLNLGTVERTRAVLTDDLSRDERARMVSRADGFLRRALAADDRDAAIWRNLAEVSLARGDAGRAREYLDAARDRTSLGDAYALYQLGRISRDAGQWQETAFAWREARATGALMSWAQEAKGREQWDRASAAFAALAVLDPNEREWLQQLVQVMRRQPGGTAAAVLELERLAEAAPRSPWPLLELATLYDEQGESAKAATLRQQAQERSRQ
jgi:Tfp pilus assembly protein PilF